MYAILVLLAQAYMSFISTWMFNPGWPFLLSFPNLICFYCMGVDEVITGLLIKHNKIERIV